MNLEARLIARRKQQGLSQQAMADVVGVYVNQIKRYEAGNSQPSLNGLKKLAKALHVSSGHLLFAESARRSAEDLRSQFEAVGQFDEDEKNTLRALIDGMILKHQAKRLLHPEPLAGPASTPTRQGLRR
ncbi:MAG: helix-turn-helix transcriptional regulator [Sterolibacteriaceae bacterium]|uniref:Helix-turn-helix transcriptional regulator n=1 Tax=Candidatus Methylophosphatis roskildensis TaxID=2899263 RepID=A0A9D7E1D5_9PROT|nr:helix-turn-helix transcriptional regulator [Candidatus Methylophosphatis roskildensis]MBK7237955.1 helix-turn-helix transcriptional regulator [Sterolibacteriaceae bacterium]